jgi:hypothetical protein
VSYAKPSTVIGRILRGFGLRQGYDFRVTGRYQGSGANRERIGTYVLILSGDADRVITKHADFIEEVSARQGHSFWISTFATLDGRPWVWVANYGARIRDADTASGKPPAYQREQAVLDYLDGLLQEGRCSTCGDVTHSDVAYGCTSYTCVHPCDTCGHAGDVHRDWYVHLGKPDFCRKCRDDLKWHVYHPAPAAG